MSYDLAFVWPDRAARELGEQAFFDWFASRPHYTRQEAQAFHDNADTGVYFSFDYDPQLAPPDDWDAEELGTWTPRVASFRLNFIRPAFFAHEAADELAAFVEHFGLLTDNPQSGEVEPFSRERFLAEWSETNASAARTMIRERRIERVHPYPGERLQRIWEWNARRAALQEEIGWDVFVPKISFVLLAGTVRSMFVWTDGLPAWMPEVDVVVLMRNALAKRRWLLFRRSPEILLAEWNDVASLLASAPRASDPLPHIRTAWKKPPANVLEFFRRGWPSVEQLGVTAIDADLVLDAAFFEPHT